MSKFQQFMVNRVRSNYCPQLIRAIHYNVSTTHSEICSVFSTLYFQVASTLRCDRIPVKQPCVVNTTFAANRIESPDFSMLLDISTPSNNFNSINAAKSLETSLDEFRMDLNNHQCNNFLS